MNNRNNQQSIIQTAAIILASIIVCIALSAGVVFIADIGSYPLNAVIGGVAGLIIAIIITQFVSRGKAQESAASNNNANSLHEPRFGLYKRSYMVARLEEEIARVKVQHENLAVALVELVYSDTQQMQDEDVLSQLLAGAVEKFQTLLPSTFTFGHDEGSTFFIIMPETTEQQAILLAQDIYASITDKPITLDNGISAKFKIIVGIVENNNGIQDAQNVLQLARRALLSAWGARYDSIGFVSGFRTASINTVQVDIVAFGAIGEFSVEQVSEEEMAAGADETIHIRDDFDLEFDLNINPPEDTLSVSPPIIEASSYVIAEKSVSENSDVITQPISPFLLDALSDDDLTEAEDQELEDLVRSPHQSTEEFEALQLNVKSKNGTEPIEVSDDAESESDTESDEDG